MLSGVIQGNGIGPVAFVIFIDGLAKLLEAHGIKCEIFADDAKVYLTMCNTDSSVILQTALNLVSDLVRD